MASDENDMERSEEKQSPQQGPRPPDLQFIILSTKTIITTLITSVLPFIKLPLFTSSSSSSLTIPPLPINPHSGIHPHPHVLHPHVLHRHVEYVFLWVLNAYH